MKPILTARVCRTNAEQFPDILTMYVPPPAKVLDMTYGNGVFWKEVKGAYKVTKNDLDPDRGTTHEDLTHLPASWGKRFDCVVLDPPYLLLGGIKTLKDSIDRGYKNKSRAGAEGEKSSYIGVVERLYASGIIEAHRVLKRSGIIIVKCMDQVYSGQQQWLSQKICDLLSILGFRVEDMFVYVSANTPTMRHEYQKHARRNHSYWIVARRRP